MISWIVASHDPTILLKNFVASVWDPGPDEFVLIENAPSIAAAYNEGQAKATHPVRCFVHHDVQVLDLPRLRSLILEHATTEVGLVGLVGSQNVAWPWWDGKGVGSVVDFRHGALFLGAKDGPCSLLDGLLLATAQTVEWDETIPGWHGYDADACLQMLSRGLTNYCLPEGHLLVSHNTGSPGDPDLLDGFHDAMARVREKWSS